MVHGFNHPYLKVYIFAYDLSNAPIFEFQNLEILYHGSNAIGSLVATMALNVVCEIWMKWHQVDPLEPQYLDPSWMRLLTIGNLCWVDFDLILSFTQYCCHFLVDYHKLYVSFPILFHNLKFFSRTMTSFGQLSFVFNASSSNTTW